ncbi:AzlD domain-containing protein [Psychrobacter ciconiae]|uniref:AzlD domain-containing protein n=1 Tax=Psychrobacter ciconiae TaxID=1553449 RepID=UPI001919E8E8|nr:AzlD domain-containing protein [Psychrobacter ciconiae]
MTSNYLIAATMAMAAVTFLTRATPALIPKKLLDTPWLHRLNESLPLSVLTLLILTSLSYQGLTPSFSNPKAQLLAAQIIALLLVLLVYHLSRQLLVSMVVGIAALNGVLWLFSFLS